VRDISRITHGTRKEAQVTGETIAGITVCGRGNQLP
jgi:hypothetical protein